MQSRVRGFAILAISAGWTLGLVGAFSKSGGCINHCHPRLGEYCPAVCITGLSPLHLVLGLLVVLLSTVSGIWLWQHSYDAPVGA